MPCSQWKNHIQSLHKKYHSTKYRLIAVGAKICIGLVLYARFIAWCVGSIVSYKDSLPDTKMEGNGDQQKYHWDTEEGKHYYSDCVIVFSWFFCRFNNSGVLCVEGVKYCNTLCGLTEPSYCRPLLKCLIDCIAGFVLIYVLHDLFIAYYEMAKNLQFTMFRNGLWCCNNEQIVHEMS